MNRLFGSLLILASICFLSIGTTLAEDRTLTLEEAVRLALAHSPDTRLAAAESRQAEAALRETRSINLPQAVIGTGAAYNNGFPLSVEGSAPSIFRFEAYQPIFSMKNKNLIREANESTKAARFGSDIVANELAARTALVYAQLDQARKITTLTEKRLLATQKQQELAEISLEAGRVRPVDVARGKAAIAASKQQLLSAQEEATVAEAELRELTGLGGIENMISIRTVSPVLESTIYKMNADELFEKTAAASPEIRQAETKIRAREFHVAAEKADRYPRIVAVGEYAMFSRANNYEDYYNRFERNNYLLGISAQFPLFDGFQSGARLARSRQEVSAEQLKLQQLKSDLRINIQKGLSALRVARGAVEVATSDLDVAEEMLKVNDVLFASGRIGESEMTEARLQVEQKELARLEAESNLFQHQLELLRVTGSVLSLF